jgi:hypothetical protein
MSVQNHLMWPLKFNVGRQNVGPIHATVGGEGTERGGCDGSEEEDEEGMAVSRGCYSGDPVRQSCLRGCFKDLLVLWLVSRVKDLHLNLVIARQDCAIVENSRLLI